MTSVEVRKLQGGKLSEETTTLFEESGRTEQEVELDSRNLADPYLLEESKTLDQKKTSLKTYRSKKEKVMCLLTDRALSRERFTLRDLKSLCPTWKEEIKWQGRVDEDMDEIAGLEGFDLISCLDADGRARMPVMWWGKAVTGPSIKFVLLDQLSMTHNHFPGNHVEGSRPILALGSGFKSSLGELIRAFLERLFGTPLNHPKSRPYYDHCLYFTFVEDKVLYMRNYQITQNPEFTLNRKALPSSQQLVEVGPRLAMTPLAVFSGCFSGQIVYKNLAVTKKSCQLQ